MKMRRIFEKTFNSVLRFFIALIVASVVFQYDLLSENIEIIFSVTVVYTIVVFIIHFIRYKNL